MTFVYEEVTAGTPPAKMEGSMIVRERDALRRAP
jgi:hypothetical protein